MPAEQISTRAGTTPFVPPSDIYETKDSIVVLAEMPGVAPDGVDITTRKTGVDDPRTKCCQGACRVSARLQRIRQGGLRARLHAFRKHRPRPARGEAEGPRVASRPAQGGNRKG